MLKIELIGDDCPDGGGRGWVAEIGFSGDRMDRRFLRAFKDYSKANSVGSRGVFAVYWLAPGKIYEVSSPQSWKSVDRYFCRVRGGRIVRLTLEGAARWLRSGRLESTY